MKKRNGRGRSNQVEGGKMRTGKRRLNEKYRMKRGKGKLNKEKMVGKEEE